MDQITQQQLDVCLRLRVLYVVTSHISEDGRTTLMAIHEVPTFGEPRMGRRFSSQPGGNAHSAIYAFNNIADCLFAKCFLFYCLFRIAAKKPLFAVHSLSKRGSSIDRD